MTTEYVHGYSEKEGGRLVDQATTLTDLLHCDTEYPAGSLVLEAGCGVGAQTVTLARKSPGATFVSVDISPDSLAQAKERVRRAGVANVDVPAGGHLLPAFRRGALRPCVRVFRAGAPGAPRPGAAWSSGVF